VSEDLIDWLRLQLDEDERVAREAPNVLDYAEWPFWVDVDDEHDHQATNAWRDHFKPARVLREVERNRRVLARHEPIEVFGDLLCVRCGVKAGGRPSDPSWPCPDVRDLAAIFDDRPGYREEWRP
jgi:hypothetical protein